MSGGVDSSVAAGLLVEQGYDVVGATMKLFCYGDAVPNRPCCSLDSITDALLVAHRLGIPHYVLNFEDRFGRDVIANFVAEYASGRTPMRSTVPTSRPAITRSRVTGRCSGGAIPGRISRISSGGSTAPWWREC